MDFTYEQFYSNELPTDVQESQKPTLQALRLLRLEFRPDSPLLTSFIKWRLPVLQDLVAVAFWKECKSATGVSDSLALVAVKHALERVDWPNINSIFEAAESAYMLHLSLSDESQDLRPHLDSLVYRLEGTSTRLNKPGDVYKIMMKNPESN